MNYVYTVLGTTAAIIGAEIVFNYGLGDKVKDLAIWLFRGAQGVAEAQCARFRAKASQAEAKIQNFLAAAKKLV